MLSRFRPKEEKRAISGLDAWGTWPGDLAPAWSGAHVTATSSLQLLTVYGCVRLITDSISTLPVAGLSWFLIERPALRAGAKARLRRWPSAIPSAPILVPAVNLEGTVVGLDKPALANGGDGLKVAQIGRPLGELHAR